MVLVCFVLKTCVPLWQYEVGPTNLEHSTLYPLKQLLRFFQVVLHCEKILWSGYSNKPL